MNDTVAVPPAEPMPTHPEEMKAVYDLRVGKLISLQGSARMTPAGLVTAGIAASAILLAVSVLVGRRADAAKGHLSSVKGFQLCNLAYAASPAFAGVLSTPRASSGGAPIWGTRPSIGWPGSK